MYTIPIDMASRWSKTPKYELDSSAPFPFASETVSPFLVACAENCLVRDLPGSRLDPIAKRGVQFSLEIGERK